MSTENMRTDVAIKYVHKCRNGIAHPHHICSAKHITENRVIAPRTVRLKAKRYLESLEEASYEADLIDTIADKVKIEAVPEEQKQSEDTEEEDDSARSEDEAEDETEDEEKVYEDTSDGSADEEVSSEDE